MDNITAPATGSVLATDEIAGVHYPRTKLSIGAEGVAVDVSADAPMPVSIIGAVPVTGTFYPATQPVSIAGTVAVSGTVGISGAVAVTGTFWQATQAVSLATLPALATGGNVIGAVTQSGTWNIGSITTLPALVAGTALIGKVGIDQTTDGTTNKVNIDASLKSGTATATTAAQTTASAAVLASNTARKGATIYNPNAGALLLSLAAGNAAAAPHIRLAQYASYEVASGFTGAITGALEAGSGNANVVEFT